MRRLIVTVPECSSELAKEMADGIRAELPSDVKLVLLVGATSATLVDDEFNAPRHDITIVNAPDATSNAAEIAAQLERHFSDPDAVRSATQ